VLRERLRSYGVTDLDLVVLTHVHADHATGLTGLVGRVPMRRVWQAIEPHETPAAKQLIGLLEQHGTRVESPSVGDWIQLGDLTITVEGPLRTYASPNDQSIVLTVRGPSRSMLLAGDIETFAQADLGHLRADVLKVPHQGAGTSDASWLQAVGADETIISVGPNQFGHPKQWVIDTLERSGAEVVRTDQAGDVIVTLGR
jgi:competence protein ComEC